VIEEQEQEPIPEQVTTPDDPAEPAGDQDPAVEKEYDEAKEAAAEEAAAPEPEDLEDEAKRYLELAQRTQAEFENYRKRAARDIAIVSDRARAKLVAELLPVVDNLERALATANPEEDHLAEGVRLVHVELMRVLERNGVQAYDPAGEPFDPNVHEAISMREGSNTPDGGAGGSGIVLDVVTKGYKLGDKVIRPAQVVVSS
jgi:molecular chaperone GrpE